jgi:ribose/xylose/arabinose/galactoside ABC-type transport system permease subunit
MRQTSYVLIIGLGAALVFISGNLDLSVGSVMGLSGLVTALCITHKIPVILSVIIGLLIGVIFGFLNGLLVVKAGIPSFIVTLGTLYIGRGFMNVLTQGKPVYPLPDSFLAIGNSNFLNLTYSFWISIFVAFLFYFILKYTIYGRQIYAVGSNTEVAYLSGLNVQRVKFSVFIICSVLASLVGIIVTSRIGSGQISTGTGWELTVLASVIIGGTSMYGGSGTVLGTVLGALLVTLLSNWMIVMRLSAYWQNVLVGAIIIIAVGIDMFRRRRSGLL